MSSEQGGQGTVEHLLPRMAQVIRLRTGLGRKAFGERMDPPVSREQVRAFEQPNANLTEKTMRRIVAAAGRKYEQAVQEELAARAAGKWPALSKEDEERESEPPPEPVAPSRKRRKADG
jgi:hypothetical protein